MRYPDGRLILFARTPVAGKVKTRLAAGLGAQAACRLYCRMIEYMVDMAVQAEVAEVVLAVWPDTGHSLFRRLGRDYPIRLVAQRGSDLGERMSQAIESQLDESEFVILIGVDCLTLDQDRLAQAADLLAQGTPWVFNPAADGGYVLVGSSRYDPAVFQGIDWGSPEVMAQTRSRCREAGLEWAELPALYDVDTHEDWLQLQHELPEVYSRLMQSVSL